MTGQANIEHVHQHVLTFSVGDIVQIISLTDYERLIYVPIHVFTQLTKLPSYL